MNILTLQRLGACTGACDWARAQPDPDTAWARCRRGDWLLWLLGRLAGPRALGQRRQLVLATSECVRHVLRLVADDAARYRLALALAVVERWACGDDTVTARDLHAAASAATCVAAADVAYVVHAVAEAVFAAAETASVYVARPDDTRYAASTAVDAVHYVASAHGYGRRHGALSSLSLCARLVRRHFPHPPTL